MIVPTQRHPELLLRLRQLLRTRRPPRLRRGCLSNLRPQPCRPAWQTMWAPSPRHLAAAHRSRQLQGPPS